MSETAWRNLEDNLRSMDSEEKRKKKDKKTDDENNDKKDEKNYILVFH